jgi:threonine/homoserine/homoserine lactone efflux protein
MSTTVLVTFIATTIILGLTPGPNMSLIVANTLAGGMRTGFVTLAGTGTGLAILATVTVLGMSSVMAFMAEWFDWVRWIGALYLVFLGTRQLLGYLRRSGDPTYAPPTVSASGAYSQGLIVALSNPKVLLFLGAFFPQFVDPSGAIGLQLAILAAIFVATLLLVDAAYTYAVGRARQAINARKLAALDVAAGALLIAGGVVLATARRPAG